MTLYNFMFIFLSRIFLSFSFLDKLEKVLTQTKQKTLLRTSHSHSTSLLMIYAIFALSHWSMGGEVLGGCRVM